MDASPRISTQARKKQAEIDVRRRALHLPVAAALRSDVEGPAIILEANVVVAMWRKHQLFDEPYVSAWTALLESPLLAAEMLEDETEKGVQFRANSPFVAAVRRFQAAG